MHTFKDGEFVGLEQDYAGLLGELGLSASTNRFDESFEVYRRINQDMKAQGTNVIPDQWTAEFKHAVYDLTELLSIYKSIKDYSYKNVLREKLKALNGGVSSPALETSGNNKARNVQFELTLFSELMESGLKCYLREPKPDIELLCVGRSYAIECKRIFSRSDSSVNNLVGEARDQLNESLGKKPLQTGIIALDVTRRLTGGTDYLRAKSEDAVKARLSHEIDLFRRQYERYWSPKRIGNKRITAVLLHASMYTYIEGVDQAAHAAHSVIQEIHSEPYSKILFRQALEDVYEPLARHKAGKGSPRLLLGT